MTILETTLAAEDKPLADATQADPHVPAADRGGSSRRPLGVSVNTAAVWLADIDIFIQDAPVISRRDLQDAIDKRQSIDDIRRQHHVTGRTVAVELRRHGLLEAHKKRHLR